MRINPVTAALLVAALHEVAWAQVPSGPDFVVNTYTTQRQYQPSVAIDANGAFIVVWNSRTQDGSSNGIFGQRFDAGGTPQGPEFQVNTYTTGRQMFPGVAADADGDFVVVWDSQGQDGDSYGVFGQRFNAEGVRQGAEFRVNTYTTGHQRAPAVASDAAGNFVVVWGSEPRPGYGVLDGQRFNAEGTPLGTEFQVNTGTYDLPNRPAVASDPLGNFIVVWGDSGLNPDDIFFGVFGRRFSAAGTPQGPEFHVNTYTTFDQFWAKVAADANGNFVVVWQSRYQDATDGFGIFGRRFTAAGAPQGGELQINTFTPFTQDRPSVGMDANGSFVVAWTDQVQEGSTYGIFGRRYDAAGNGFGPEFLINSYTFGGQAEPSVAVTPDGNFVAVWTSNSEIRGRRFASLPTVSVDDVTVTEGAAGSVNADFTLSLSAAVSHPVSVNFASANGSAVAPEDFTALSGTRSFAPGTVTQTISVPIVGDTVVEADETFFVSLGGAIGATIADALGVGTITNDDQPVLAINDASVVEGNSGTTNAVVTVTLSQSMANPVTVNFATSNGTATEPEDYAPVMGTLGFSPGMVTQTISVPVAGDFLSETDETFFVNLSGASGATIGDDQGLGTITNDDFPSISVDDVTVLEGNTTPTNAVFTVGLSQSAPFMVSVNYGSAAGTATVGEDFGPAAGTLIFPQGTTTLPAAVPVFGDWHLEPNETFSLNLSAPSGATLADGTGVGTITDDDTAGLSIADVAVRERVGTTATVTYTVTLAPASGGSVTVDYATADGTATAPGDYLAASGTLTFASGETTKPVAVTVNADALVEELETFSLNLTGASGATIAHGTAAGRILDPPLGGDFNADGNNDLVWRHDVSGQNVIWYMDGTTLLGGTFTTPAALEDAGWRIVGTNDFNADGRPDLLWRHRVSGENVLWYMNGSVLQGGEFLTPAALVDVNWGMSGTGDFNLDGKPDIFWRHAVSGEVVVWYMIGSVLQSGEFLTPSAFTDLNWQSVGTGDFNLDGHPDILWRHAVAGQNVVWFLKGSSLMSGAFLNPPALEDVNWRMVATSDYNDDGKVDIVWRHSVSGQNVLWFMDGIILTGGGFTDTLADVNWKIVGPR